VVGCRLSGLPRCPDCESHSRLVGDFAYASDARSVEEGHDTYPDTGTGVETSLVRPDCGVVIG
jgi:hypothetical protein